ncbi:hypothetical protein BaRGS_00001132 [Batillaria attramentaria]|uniref:Uncharacterized protein n=1 Tax=Batillaria attramentaria TaxID=370345 RepID=A0ABD0M6B4_9CAEN
MTSKCYQGKDSCRKNYLYKYCTQWLLSESKPDGSLLTRALHHQCFCFALEPLRPASSGTHVLVAMGYLCWHEECSNAVCTCVPNLPQAQKAGVFRHSTVPAVHSTSHAQYTVGHC